MNATTTTTASRRLNGLSVLVVEDESIIYFLLEDMLRELGCADVRHATDVDDALTLLRERRPDAAVLDVNLAGESAFAVAEQLDAARVPFVFATGYGRGGLPARWAPHLVIQKPFRVETLGAALAAVLQAAPAGEGAKPPSPV